MNIKFVEFAFYLSSMPLELQCLQTANKMQLAIRGQLVRQTLGWPRRALRMALLSCHNVGIGSASFGRIFSRRIHKGHASWMRFCLLASLLLLGTCFGFVTPKSCLQICVWLYIRSLPHWRNWTCHAIIGLKKLNRLQRSRPCEGLMFCMAKRTQKLLWIK